MHSLTSAKNPEMSEVLWVFLNSDEVVFVNSGEIQYFNFIGNFKGFSSPVKCVC
jgi:hypothetical protein